MKSKIRVVVYAAIAVCLTLLICQWRSASRVPSEAEGLVDALRAQVEALSGLNRVQERQLHVQQELINSQENLIEIQDVRISALEEMVELLERGEESERVAP